MPFGLSYSKSVYECNYITTKVQDAIEITATAHIEKHNRKKMIKEGARIAH